MDAKDGFAAAAIWQLHQDLAVEATRTQQGRIQDIGPVGGRQHDDSGVLLEPVHLREQLVERLFALVVATTDASPALAANGIDLIDENDAGGLGFGLTEQITNAAGSHPHEHLDKFRGREGEERHLGFPGNGPGQKCFAGSRRANQEHAAGDSGAQCRKAFRLFEEGDHLLQFCFGFIDASDVVEAHVHGPFRLHPRLGAAKAQSFLGHVGGAPEEQHQEPQHHHGQQAIDQQAGHGGFPLAVAHIEGHVVGLGGAQHLLVVRENIDLGRLPVFELNLHQILFGQQHQLLHLTGAHGFQQLAVTR